MRGHDGRNPDLDSKKTFVFSYQFWREAYPPVREEYQVWPESHTHRNYSVFQDLRCTSEHA